jgi:hypothetical protein
LTAFALVAVPGFLVEVRRRSAGAVLLACWIAAPLAAVLVWQYRNIAYLLPIVPALAILAASFGPFAARRPPIWMLLLAAAAFTGKVLAPSAPWGLSFAQVTVTPVAPLLSSYCERNRANELIVVGADDDLYGSALPLAKLRYCLIGSAAAFTENYAMPFEDLGITLTAPQFDDLDRWEPVFRPRLREWGLDSGEAIGTLIVAATPEELGQIIRLHPASDFLVPNRYRRAVDAEARPGHEMVVVLDHFFLLARNGQVRNAPPAWSCRL